MRIVRWARPRAERRRTGRGRRGWAPPPAPPRAGLRAAGVTVALAPVADVPTVAGSALAGRAFAASPARRPAPSRAAVRGWRAGGVAPTLKHFPGLGGARVNTDEGPADVRRRAGRSAPSAPGSRPARRSS